MWPLALVVTLVGFGTAFAQSPLTATPDPASSTEWTFTPLDISLLPGGTSLGALWMDACIHSHLVTGQGVTRIGNEIYSARPDPDEPIGKDSPMPQHTVVWAVRGQHAVGAGSYGATPDPREPGEGPSGEENSTMYQWDGTTWEATLTLKDEVGRAVFGPADSDVFAATVTRAGAPRMYHYDGRAWMEQALPKGLAADAGAIDGEHNDIFFRAGERVLHYDGAAWRVAHTDARLKGGGALVYINRHEVYAIGPGGHASWDGTAWRWLSAPALGEVRHAWGERNASGVLRLYATGRSLDTNQMTVWTFCESAPPLRFGAWATCEAIPLGSHSSTGTGLAIWGSDKHVYVVGEEDGSGRFLDLVNGRWSSVWQPGQFPAANDILQTPTGEVWMSLANGRLLKGTPPSVMTDPSASASFDDNPISLTRTLREGVVQQFEVSLSNAADVQIAAFDISGRLVATIDRGHWDAGKHVVSWNVHGVAPGLYLCRLAAGNARVTQKVIVQ